MNQPIRQAMFRPDGTLTDVPTKETEQPQLEKQGDLLLWQKENALLKGLADGY